MIALRRMILRNHRKKSTMITAENHVHKFLILMLRKKIPLAQRMTTSTIFLDLFSSKNDSSWNCKFKTVRANSWRQIFSHFCSFLWEKNILRRSALKSMSRWLCSFVIRKHSDSEDHKREKIFVKYRGRFFWVFEKFILSVKINGNFEAK